MDKAFKARQARDVEKAYLAGGYLALLPENEPAKFPNIRKIGKWSVTPYRHGHAKWKIRFEISDGIHAEQPIVYDDGRVAYEFPEKIPENVRKWFEGYAFLSIGLAKDIEKKYVD